ALLHLAHEHQLAPDVIAPVRRVREARIGLRARRLQGVDDEVGALASADFLVEVVLAELDDLVAEAVGPRRRGPEGPQQGGGQKTETDVASHRVPSVHEHHSRYANSLTFSTA